MERRTALVGTCPSVLVVAGDAGARRGASHVQRTCHLWGRRGEQ
jgi:hypothetical protein